MRLRRRAELGVPGVSHDGALVRSGSPYLVAGALALVLTVSFYTTAPKTSVSSDPLANVLTAWTVAEHGSFVLSEHEQLVSPHAYFQLTWIVRGEDGPVSIFPPGAALLAAPLYVVGPDELIPAAAQGAGGDSFHYGLPRLEPSVLVAAASTAIAVALLFLTLVRVGSLREALAGSLIFATATGAWSVASQSLWQHGPAMMWLAVALWSQGSLRRELAWIPAILTRPLVAVFAATKFVYELFMDRRWRRLVLPVAFVSAGAALFLVYNRLAFGSWSPLAAYADLHVLSLWDTDLIAWGRNIVGAVVDPKRGLLIISPFLVALIPGLRAAWKASPGFVRASAMAGVAYLLIHYKTHHFAGGDRFFGYRYPLEALLAAAPLLYLSYQQWVRDHRFRLALFGSGVAVAIGLQAYAVLNPYQF
ncbi:MAG: hypothetical protein R3258_02685 [Acidimicrobiia bacterium]|nr:hypothetical protein [Acidimicrobiia bacterium]